MRLMRLCSWNAQLITAKNTEPELQGGLFWFSCTLVNCMTTLYRVVTRLQQAPGSTVLSPLPGIAGKCSTIPFWSQIQSRHMAALRHGHLVLQGNLPCWPLATKPLNWINAIQKRNFNFHYWITIYASSCCVKCGQTLMHWYVKYVHIFLKIILEKKH